MMMIGYRTRYDVTDVDSSWRRVPRHVSILSFVDVASIVACLAVGAVSGVGDFLDITIHMTKQTKFRRETQDGENI
jgi:hypothetical protein